jgi:hypothetical protein
MFKYYLPITYLLYIGSGVLASDSYGIHMSARPQKLAQLFSSVRSQLAVFLVNFS